MRSQFGSSHASSQDWNPCLKQPMFSSFEGHKLSTHRGQRKPGICLLVASIHCVTSGKQLSSLSQSLPDPCLSLQQECCGTSGPMDWVNFTSAFRAATPEVAFPWPPLCCRRTGNFIPLSEEGCRLGHIDYLFTKVCPLPPAAPV